MTWDAESRTPPPPAGTLDAHALLTRLADTAIAEWQAEFDDTAQGVRKRMREVALLVFDGGRIASLREYWASELVELSPAARVDGQHPASPNGQ
jgi:hypothetical protein